MSHVEARKCGLHVSFSQNGAKCRSRVSFPSTGCATNPRCSKTLYAIVPHELTLIRGGRSFAAGRWHRKHVERLRRVTTDLLSFAREEEDEPCDIVLGEIVGRMIRLLERTSPPRAYNWS